MRRKDRSGQRPYYSFPAADTGNKTIFRGNGGGRGRGRAAVPVHGAYLPDKCVLRAADSARNGRCAHRRKAQGHIPRRASSYSPQHTPHLRHAVRRGGYSSRASAKDHRTREIRDNGGHICSSDAGNADGGNGKTVRKSAAGQAR